VEAEFAGDEKHGRKSSTNVRRKRDAKFGDRSAGLGVVARKKGHIKGYTGIYIGLGFGNISQFLNFRIILIPRIKYFQKM
jgi:hypothetical protein